MPDSRAARGYAISARRHVSDDVPRHESRGAILLGCARPPGRGSTVRRGRSRPAAPARAGAPPRPRGRTAPIIAAVFEGTNAVAATRQAMGVTDPAEAAPGTIRGDFALEIGRNLVHGSDSVESAEREIALFFEGQPLIEWARDTDRWIFEQPASVIRGIGAARGTSWSSRWLLPLPQRVTLRLLRRDAREALSPTPCSATGPSKSLSAGAQAEGSAPPNRWLLARRRASRGLGGIFLLGSPPGRRRRLAATARDVAEWVVFQPQPLDEREHV